MASGEGMFSRADRSGVPLLVARLVLGGLFVWMGIAKIVDDPAHFLKLMRQYQALPTSWPHFLNFLAVVLPWIETVCGIALLLGVAVRGAGVVTATMLVLFTPLILMRGLELFHEGGVSFCGVKFDCGCGAGEVYLCSKLAENVGLLLLALLAVLSRSRRYCLESLIVFPQTRLKAMAENQPLPE